MPSYPDISVAVVLNAIQQFRAESIKRDIAMPKRGRITIHPETQDYLIELWPPDGRLKHEEDGQYYLLIDETKWRLVASAAVHKRESRPGRFISDLEFHADEND